MITTLIVLSGFLFYFIVGFLTAGLIIRIFDLNNEQINNGPIWALGTVLWPGALLILLIAGFIKLLGPLGVQKAATRYISWAETPKKKRSKKPEIIA